MKKTILVAAASVLITLAGTAIAYSLLAGNAGPGSYTDVPYGQYAASGAPQQYGGCRGAGRGGCSGCGRPGADAQVTGQQVTDLKAIEDLAAKYYSETYGDTDFKVQVQDFGCHQEAYIIKDGQPVKRLSISGGNVYEVG